MIKPFQCNSQVCIGQTDKIHHSKYSACIASRGKTQAHVQYVVVIDLFVEFCRYRAYCCGHSCLGRIIYNRVVGRTGMKIVRGVADVKRCTETNVIIVVFRLTGTTRLGTAPPRPPPLRTTIISHLLREAAATSSAADCSFTLEVPAHFRTVEVEAFVHATHAAGDTRASLRQSTRQPTS